MLGLADNARFQLTNLCFTKSAPSSIAAKCRRPDELSAHLAQRNALNVPRNLRLIIGTHLPEANLARRFIRRA
jgi:hypothetical protein